MPSVRSIAGKTRPQSQRRQQQGLSEEDVIRRIVSLSTRFGTRIQLQQLSSVPQTPQEAQILPQIEQEIEQKRDSLATKRLASLEARAEVLRITGGFRSLLKGRLPTVYQVLAVPAIQHGLNSPQLDDLSRSMMTTWLDYRGQVTWQGVPSMIRKSVRRKMPERCERILFNAKNRSLDSRELLVAMGESTGRQDYLVLNCACQLLETAGFVRKQPLHSDPGVVSGDLSVWSHRAYKNPFPRHPNTRFYILDALYNNGSPQKLWTTDLYKQSTSRGFTRGNPNAPYSAPPILDSIRFLEDAGLVGTKTISFKLSHPATLAELTTVAERYLKRMYDTHSLPEGLRKLLIGAKT